MPGTYDHYIEMLRWQWCAALVNHQVPVPSGQFPQGSSRVPAPQMSATVKPAGNGSSGSRT